MAGQERYEVQVDTELARLYGLRDKQSAKASLAMDSLHYAAGDRREYRGRFPAWKMSYDEVMAFRPNAEQPWKVQEHTKALDSFKAAQQTIAILRAQIAQQNELYTGWSRFFLVTNKNGHIHSSMGCSTCFPSTTFAWLPALSGLKEKDAVAAHGPRLCTVCFPSAPVEWTVGIQSDKTYCPGSGKPAAPSKTRWSRCAKCEKLIKRTSFGLLRKHA